MLLLFSKFPLFQWESPALRFELVVCEKLPENDSPEDALNNEPHLKTEINTTFYQYPFTSQSGIRALEEGHTYCWQLSAMVQTSSGQVKIKSEIGEFQIANPSLKSGAKLSDEEKQIIITLNQLLSELGLQKWLENFMKEYPDYKPTGDIIIDGKKISGAEFVRLLKKLRSEGFGILKIEVE